MEILYNMTLLLLIGLILCITGYLLFKLIANPIRFLKFMIKVSFFVILGCLVWVGIVYFIVYI